MATITNSIGAGRDYSTVADWVSATTGLLGTDIYRGEVYDDFDEDVNITGGSTSATSYRVLSVPTAYRHLGIPGSGPALIRGSGTWSSGQKLINIGEAYSRVEWLEVTALLTGGGAVFRYGVYLDAANTRASHMIVHDLLADAGAAEGLRTANAVADALIYRSIAYGMDTTANSAGIVSYAGGASVHKYVYSNTTYGCSTGYKLEAFNLSGATVHARNNVGAGNSAADFSWFKGASGTINASYNASTDATADDQGATGALINQALASLGFANAAAGDFHISSTSVLRGAGTSLGSPYDLDIDGQTVADGAWDIGADEYATSAAAAITLPMWATDGTGTIPVNGASALTLPALTVSASAAPTVSGDSALTLPAFAVAATGTLANVIVTLPSAPAFAFSAGTALGVVIEGAEANAALTLPGWTASGAGGVAVQGDAAATLPAFSVSAAAAVAVQGAGAATLPMLTLSATGGDINSIANAAVTLPQWTVSGAGTIPVNGASALTLPAFTVLASSSVAVVGSSAVTLPVLVISGDGATAVQGEGAITLPMWVLSGSTVAHAASLAYTPGTRVMAYTPGSRSMAYTPPSRG